jgi:hypothetical protein
MTTTKSRAAGVGLRTRCGRNASARSQYVRHGRDLRVDRALHHQRGGHPERGTGSLRLVDHRVPSLPDPWCDRDRSARPDVPGRRFDLSVDAEGFWTVLGLLRRVLRVVAGGARDGGDGHGRTELSGLRLSVDDRCCQRAGAGRDHHRVHRVVGGPGQPKVPADPERRQRGVCPLRGGDRVGGGRGHGAFGGRSDARDEPN